jgi:hypothetical protein
MIAAARAASSKKPSMDADTWAGDLPKVVGQIDDLIGEGSRAMTSLGLYQPTAVARNVAFVVGVVCGLLLLPALFWRIDGVGSQRRHEEEEDAVDLRVEGAVRPENHSDCVPSQAAGA